MTGRPWRPPSPDVQTTMIDSVSGSAGADENLRKVRRQKAARADARPTVDRLPPHAAEAEKGALGCQLIAPAECVPEVFEKLKGDAAAFYDLRHQEIQKALFGMYDRREPVDVITLQQKLKDEGLLEQCGGIAYLSELQDAVPSAANLSYYLDILREKFLLRKMITVCTETVGRIYDYEGEVDQLLDEVEADVLQVNDLRQQHEAKPRAELVADDLTRIETMRRGVGTVDGIRTHLGHLDKWTCGLHLKEMIVLAGRPSLGKTSLAMTIARNVAGIEKKSVGIFSLEMGDASLIRRDLCAEAEVDSHKLRTGFASLDDLKRIGEAGPHVGAMPIYIDDTPALGILDLRARARRWVSRQKIELIIVDYLQLMHGVTNKEYRGNREREIADISAGLKGLAKELNLPVLVLSQLNRELERNKTRKPQLADLRDSGAVEQDADMVWMLYRPKTRRDPVSGQVVEISDDPCETDIEQPVNLLIAKQRNGPSDWDVELVFLKPYTKFVDAYGNRGKVSAQEK